MNEKQEIEEKLEKIGLQIHYMRQVSKDRKKPPMVRESAQKSLENLLKEQDALLDSFAKRKIPKVTL